MVVVGLVLVASIFKSDVFLVSWALVIATESDGFSTVTDAVALTPPRDPVIVTAVSAVTAVNAIVKSTVVAPAGTVTDAGTDATAGLSLERRTGADAFTRTLRVRV